MQKLQLSVESWATQDTVRRPSVSMNTYMLSLFSCTDALANVSAAFGPGTGAIYGTGVACAGTESQLADCQYTALGGGVFSICSHLNDAGVTCNRTRKSYNHMKQ